jgi:predicted DNA-binding antitoxin AbrB/MazE fold protein
MRITLEAIFEGGVFRPVRRVAIPEGEHVELTVETAERTDRDDPLKLAVRVYRDLRPDEIDKVERIALDRLHFSTNTS